MGSFLFKWEHAASEVYVTGTFDDWARSVLLEKKGDHFEKLVELPLTNDKISYKFVVDGNWTTDHTAPQETDESNNVNNILLPENITGPHSASISAATNMMSGVQPDSTTVGLAANVPKESDKAEQDARPGSASSDIPGSFPETPFHDANEFAVDPIPATSGTGNPINLQPGEKVPHPNALTDNTVQSTVQDDPSLKNSAEDSENTFGVTPIPASSGIGNPISLQPGEKVPHHNTLTGNTISSNVTTDKESYEKAGGTGPAASNGAKESSRDIPSMPPVLGTMIPESSLPMGDKFGSSDPGVTIQSAGANSTTAALAGQVPLEPRGVPTVVSESQKEAGVDSGANAGKDAVKEKSAVENELQSKVPEEPPASESTPSKDSSTAAGAAGGAARGIAAAAVGSSGSKDLPPSAQQSIDEMNRGSGATPIAPAVPDVVQESIAESHTSPEAAGDKNMVGEKSAVENQLLSQVPKENDVGQPAPSSAAALSETAPAATESKGVSSKDSAPATNATSAPPAKESASVTPAAAPAQTPAAQNAMRQAVQSEPDSRDISPMSKPNTQAQTQPSVTTGVGSSSTPQKSETSTQAAAASKPSPASTSSAATDKKSKRSSGFFGKLKSKFSDKDKK
ncbi:Cruciform DNA binding protein [Lecanora helva]